MGTLQGLWPILVIREREKERICTEPIGRKYVTGCNKFLIIEPKRCTHFSKILFWNETLHVSDSFSVHHQEIFTVHTAMV